jgi:flavin-dependent dehydrogenase
MATAQRAERHDTIEVSIGSGIGMTIAATIGVATVGTRYWDAVVVGAGPAGTLAARQLARQGRAVLLIDRASFPRWKVCGACVNARALTTLAKVGLERLTRDCGAVPLTGMQVAAWGRPVTLALAGGVALSREALDAALVHVAVAAGASFLPETQARVHDATPAGRNVVLRHYGQEVTVTARVVIAANGLGSVLSTRDGETQSVVKRGARVGAGVTVDDAPRSYEPETIYMACGTGGYVGLVRIEDGRLNIAAALDFAAIRRHHGVGPLAAAIVAEGGLPAVPALDRLPWRGTPALTRHPLRPAAERLLLVGDAAGYVEPFTGEGIAWALASGVAVAELAGCAEQRWDAALERQWTARHRDLIVRRQWACRLIAAVLRRPALARLTAVALESFPRLFSPVVHYVNGPACVMLQPSGTST